MKKIIIITLFFISFKSFSQLSFTVYENKAVGLEFPVNAPLYLQVKAYTNMYVNSMKIEPTIMVNIRRTKLYNINIGAGVVMVPTDMQYLRFSVPMGVSVYPFRELRNFSIVMEVAPEFYNNVYIRSMWGIRYSFIKMAK